MKRRDLISQLEKSGCYLIRRGGKHDIYHSLLLIEQEHLFGE